MNIFSMWAIYTMYFVNFSHTPGCQGSLSSHDPLFSQPASLPCNCLCSGTKACHHTWLCYLLFIIIFMTHSAYLVSSLVPFLSFLHELTSRNSLLTLLPGDGHLDSFHIGGGTDNPAWLWRLAHGCVGSCINSSCRSSEKGLTSLVTPPSLKVSSCLSNSDFSAFGCQWLSQWVTKEDFKEI